MLHPNAATPCAFIGFMSLSFNMAAKDPTSHACTQNIRRFSLVGRGADLVIMSVELK